MTTDTEPLPLVYHPVTGEAIGADQTTRLIAFIAEMRDLARRTENAIEAATVCLAGGKVRAS